MHEEKKKCSSFQNYLNVFVHLNFHFEIVMVFFTIVLLIASGLYMSTLPGTSNCIFCNYRSNLKAHLLEEWAGGWEGGGWS